jgi:hypothetical protein
MATRELASFSRSRIDHGQTRGFDDRELGSIRRPLLASNLANPSSFASSQAHDVKRYKT